MYKTEGRRTCAVVHVGAGFIEGMARFAVWYDLIEGPRGFVRLVSVVRHAIFEFGVRLMCWKPKVRCRHYGVPLYFLLMLIASVENQPDHQDYTHFWWLVSIAVCL